MSRGGWLSGEPGRVVWSAGDAPIAAPPAPPASAPIVLGAKKRAKKAVELPTILVDTREQTPLGPWLFEDESLADVPDAEPEKPLAPWMLREGERLTLPTRIATLATGDYTIAGLEDHVRVERKSLGDMIGTLVGSKQNSVGERVGEQERFRAELHRMRAFPCRLLLIEAERRDVWEHRYRSRALPHAIMGLIDSLTLDYSLPVIWASDHEEAGRILGALLHRVWLQAKPGSEDAKKAVKRGIAEHLPWCGTVAKAGST